MPAPGDSGLRPIRDDAHPARAIEVIDHLLECDLDSGQQDDPDILTDPVEAYEDEHLEIADAPEADVRRRLMGSNGLSQSELHRRTGIAQGTISAVLEGDRSLTRQQMAALRTLFGVSPAAFPPGQ